MPQLIIMRQWPVMHCVKSSKIASLGQNTNYSYSSADVRHLLRLWSLQILVPTRYHNIMLLNGAAGKQEHLGRVRMQVRRVPQTKAWMAENAHRIRASWSIRLASYAISTKDGNMISLTDLRRSMDNQAGPRSIKIPAYASRQEHGPRPAA